jgi:chromosome partitioning protein
VIVSAQAARLPNFLKTAADNRADLVILDTPPRVEHAALAAAKVADLILIPCLPAINDLETLATTVELIRFAGQLQTLVVLNGIPPRGARREQAEHVIRDMSMEVCPVSNGYRTAFP